MIDLSHAVWRKAIRSGTQGGDENCVEVASLRAAVAVRDSKNPDDGALVLGPAAWRRAVAAVKAGRYDL
jgi:hypothetical protein